MYALKIEKPNRLKKCDNISGKEKKKSHRGEINVTGARKVLSNVDEKVYALN